MSQYDGQMAHWMGRGTWNCHQQIRESLQIYEYNPSNGYDLGF